MTGEPGDRSPGLELDGTAFRALLDAVGRHLAAFLDHIDEPWPPSVTCAPSLLEVREEGQAAGPVLDSLFGPLARASVHTAGPGYLAYIPGGGLPTAAVGDLVALVLNRFGGYETMAAGLVGAEWAVIRWLAAGLGLPKGAGGLLLSGGSMANLVALHTARVQRGLEGCAEARIYVSDQVHHSLKKGARVLGFAPEVLSVVPSDGEQRMTLAALQRIHAQDERAGLRPLAVITSAGTTNTGAIDELGPIGRWCQEKGLWNHVDGAYGGCFRFSNTGRELLDGIELADSVTLDPHKGFGLPYGTGALLVRRHGDLVETHTMEAAYLGFPRDAVQFADAGPELSREVRGLRLWLPLQLHGAAAFRSNLDEKLALAQLVSQRIAERPWLEAGPPGPLTVRTFRWVSAVNPEDDGLQKALVAAVVARGRVHLSGTTVAGRFWVRIAVLSFRTHRQHIDLAFEEIDAVCGQVLEPEGSEK